MQKQEQFLFWAIAIGLRVCAFSGSSFVLLDAHGEKTRACIESKPTNLCVHVLAINLLLDFLDLQDTAKELILESSWWS